MLCRALSIVLVALGTGLLAYGLAVDGDHYRRPAGLALLATPSESMAWGAGILVAGALSLLPAGRRVSGDRDRCR